MIILYNYFLRKSCKITAEFADRTMIFRVEKAMPPIFGASPIRGPSSTDAVPNISSMTMNGAHVLDSMIDPKDFGYICPAFRGRTSARPRSGPRIIHFGAQINMRGRSGAHLGSLN